MKIKLTQVSDALLIITGLNKKRQIVTESDKY